MRSMRGGLLIVFVNLTLSLVGARATSAQTCSQLPPGAVSWWPADASAIDLVDGNDATLVNGAAFGPGIVLGSFLLDGVNDYVQGPDSPNLYPSGSFSIEAWFNTTQQVGSQAIASKYECGDLCPSCQANSYYGVSYS